MSSEYHRYTRSTKMSIFADQMSNDVTDGRGVETTQYVVQDNDTESGIYGTGEALCSICNLSA